MFKKLKKNGNKGFTLVELIVVLVILAILAALLIPALTGYIDRARDKQIIAATRQAVMAAQTLADEAYAAGTASTSITFGSGGIALEDVEKLAELKKGTVTSVTATKSPLSTDPVTGAKISSYPITELEYEDGGKKCTYTYSYANGAKYEVDKEASGGGETP